MKIFIPELGSRLKLTKSHSFKIEFEARNDDVIKVLFPKIFEKYSQLEKEYHRLYNIHRLGSEDKEFSASYENLKSFENNNSPTIKIPKGEILEIDRIYIRKGAKDFSSVTFRWRSKKVRFWVKLKDINGLEFTEEKNWQELNFPNGRFTLGIKEKRIYLNCDCYKTTKDFDEHLDNCPYLKQPIYKYVGLIWQEDYKSEKTKKVWVFHYKDSSGIEEYNPKKAETRNNFVHLNYYGAKEKHFATLEELITAARKRDCEEEHIKKFVEEYNQTINQ